MTREETIQELGEWLEQMIQHGVPSHSAKRKALATAIALLLDEDEWIPREHFDVLKKNYDMLAGLLEEAKARAIGAWIPCSERLPEDGTTVLTFDSMGDIEFGSYENGKWYWLAEACADYWTRNSGVLAWMPLPIPYREDGE